MRNPRPGQRVHHRKYGAGTVLEGDVRTSNKNRNATHVLLDEPYVYTITWDGEARSFTMEVAQVPNNQLEEIS